MPTRLLTLLLFLVATLPNGNARASAGLQPRQTEREESFEDLERRAVAEHRSGEFRKAVELFERCLELRPTSAGTAYNIACGYARLAEPDTAFEWLDKAAELGLGHDERNLENAKVDPDMESLREDPRFDAFITRMETLRDELERYWKQPLIHLPPDHEEGQKLGMLVVLHELGVSKAATLAEWKPLAEHLGLALVVPSGMMLGSSADPKQGMVWFQDIGEYRARYWHYEQPIDLALKAFEDAHELDRTRVLLAGVGQGATVAFSQAMRMPTFFEGVLIDSGPVIVDNLDTRKRQQAIDAGLKVRTICSKEGAWGLPKASFRTRLETMGNTLARWNLGAPYSYYDPAVEGERDRYRRVALSTLLPGPAPAEASSPR